MSLQFSLIPKYSIFKWTASHISVISRKLSYLEALEESGVVGAFANSVVVTTDADGDGVAAVGVGDVGLAPCVAADGVAPAMGISLKVGVEDGAAGTTELAWRFLVRRARMSAP